MTLQELWNDSNIFHSVPLSPVLSRRGLLRSRPPNGQRAVLNAHIYGRYPIEDSTLEQLKGYYAENEKGKLNWFFKREASKAERKPRTPKGEAQPTEAVEEQPAQEVQPAKRGRRSSKKQIEEVAA